MHGIIFNELRKYVIARLGKDGWGTLLDKAGLAKRNYLPTQSYPDQEVVTLVTTASSLTGIGAATLLEDFGEFIVPDLVAMFKSLLKPQWGSLDVLEHTEETIHKIVRLEVADAAPPRLSVRRIAPNQVRITYDSPRRLCSVAKGIVRGVAKAYGDNLLIRESQCMSHGSTACMIDVTK